MRIDIIKSALVYRPRVKVNFINMINATNRGWFPPAKDWQFQVNEVFSSSKLESIGF